MSDRSTDAPAHRRDFVRGVALGAGVSFAGSSAVARDDKKDEKKPDAPRTEADARMDLLLARFGKHKQLDDKAKAVVRAEVEGLVRRAETLRKIPVDNSEGPFPVFRPFRKPEDA